jgi:hypothetical protein
MPRPTQEDSLVDGVKMGSDLTLGSVSVPPPVTLRLLPARFKHPQDDLGYQLGSPSVSPEGLAKGVWCDWSV